MNTKFNAILKKTAITSVSLVLLMASACKKDQPVQKFRSKSFRG
ncbi:hypothetical protein [Pedobacter sp. NJ-S-72]